MQRVKLFAVGCVLGWPAPLLGQATVPKSNPMKVYAHYMPWFQTPLTLGPNHWGWHWTMNTRNPNIIDPNGQREIASHYYPLIGPYDSTDRDVIEYHMLLMKVSGIDGVILDWYGTHGTNGDIGSLLTASNTIINKVPNYGLKFGVCLEDRFAASTSDVKANVDYAKQNYFTNPAYIRAGSANQPLMPIFGPVTYHQPSQWSTIMSGPGEQPAAMPLWYQSQEVGSPAKGEFAWIYQDANTNDHLTHQQNFLANRSQAVDLAMGAAYPGFNDYYQQGGAGNTLFYIPSNNGQTLSNVLALDSTYSANIDMLQLDTFNDFGEGTMFEPTVENGFSYLQQVQRFTGVSYGLAELELVLGLYNVRKGFAGNGTVQAQLDQVANSINQLDFATARLTLDAIAVPRWAVTGGGDWHTPGNWNGSIPNGINATAVFGSAMTAPGTVASNVAVTDGTITFDNSNSYTLAGAGSLTLQVSTGSAGINVLRGMHKISLPLTIASNTTVTVASGSTLRISGPVTINAGKTVVEAPGGGALLYESSVDVLSGGGLQMRSSSHMTRLSLASNATATLLLSGGSSAMAQQIDTLSLSSNAILDANDNSLLSSTSKSTIAALVKSARHDGAWNGPGITSTAARNSSGATNLGVLSGAEYSSVGGAGTFAGRSYADSDTLVKYTWNGDTDFNGVVNFDDYVRTDNGFNNHLSGWLNGDFDFNGQVNFDDYVLIDLGFNTQNGTLRRAQSYISGDDRSMRAMDDPALQMLMKHDAQFGLEFRQQFLAAVPEPASSICGVGAFSLSLLLRSRRQCKEA